MAYLTDNNSLSPDSYEHPSVSIIIRVRNEADALQQLLARLREQELDSPFEVLVIDNESSDSSAAIAYGTGARVFTLPRTSFGYGRAINIGVNLCRTDLIVLLSAHSWPQSNLWLKEMRDCLVRDDRLAAAYCRQKPGDRACRQEHGRFIAFREYDYRLDQKELIRRCKAGEDVYDVCCFSNSACIIRREAALRFPFRDLLFAEDRAFVLDCVTAGWAVLYCSTALVTYERRLTFKSEFRFGRWSQISAQLIRELGSEKIGEDMSRAEISDKMARLAFKPITMVVRLIEALIRNRAQLRRAAHYTITSLGTAWGSFLGELVWRKYRKTLDCDMSALRNAEQRTSAWHPEGNPADAIVQ